MLEGVAKSNRVWYAKIFACPVEQEKTPKREEKPFDIDIGRSQKEREPQPGHRELCKLSPPSGIKATSWRVETAFANKSRKGQDEPN